MDQIEKLLGDLSMGGPNEQDIVDEVESIIDWLALYIVQVEEKHEDKITSMQYIVDKFQYIRDMFLVVYHNDIFEPNNENEGEFDAFKD